MEKWRESLSQEVWEEGKVIPLRAGSYRHRVVVVCYSAGRQTAEFANGQKKFGAYVELVRADGSWIEEGNNIVPVLPDGRLLMVVEQRPAHYAWGNKPPTVLIGGIQVDLARFGPYSSLEFPGGAVDAGENFTSGFLRELTGETGVTTQTAVLYTRRFFNPSGADCALRQRLGVILLQDVGFENFTPGDGGLQVFALDSEEVQKNIWAGVVDSGQAAIFGWSFFQELKMLLADSSAMAAAIKAGHITRQEVKINK